MPESMFGPPLQHLLPSQAPASTGDSSGTSEPHTAPVHPAPPQFKDFRFSSIGKQPELLSRISLPNPDSADYHSPTPSPTSTPPLVPTNDFQSKSSSRPTLLQKLVGNDISSVGGWSVSKSRSNGSLVSRIQMSGSPPNDAANVHGTASGFPPPLRISTARHAPEDADLIPPVEVLPQSLDSSPPTPTSWVPTLEPAGVNSPGYSTPIMNTTTAAASRIPISPTVAADAATHAATEPSSSLTVIDEVTRDLGPSPSANATIDSLVTRQGILRSISDRLANLALPFSPPSQSPPLATSFKAQAGADIIPSQSQHSSTPRPLRHPYTPDQLGLSINNTQTETNDSLVPVPLPTSLTEEFQSKSAAIATAIRNLHSVFNAAYCAQNDSQNALALRVRKFEEERTALEQWRQEQKVMLQKELQELQQKREELDAKEATLASSEKEYKAREEAWRAMLAKRQVQEEERRVAETKRVQGVQQQIEIAMDELRQIDLLRAKCQVGPLVSATVQNDLPTRPQEGMNKEEREAIESRNSLLCAEKQLRRTHTDQVQKLEEANRTLRRLGAERESREAEETLRGEVEEETCSQGDAEIQRVPQPVGERRPQPEAERKCREVENRREQAQPLVEQQVHAEAQAQDLGRVEADNDRILELSALPGEPSTHDTTEILADMARVRASQEENTRGTTNAMAVDKDESAIVHSRTARPSDVHTSSGSSELKMKDKPISGGVMLAASTSKAGNARLPPKPLKVPPSHSSDHITTNVTNVAIPVSTEGGHTPYFPVALASGPCRSSNIDIRPTPDHRPAFSRTPKSQTILDSANGGSQELNIGPLTNVSPAQQNVNLRHLKRFRGRGEGNDTGDRSVRTVQVKSEENSYLIPKREEQDDQSLELVQALPINNPPASLPPRPSVIPPPRPRMSRKTPAAQTDSSSPYPPKSNELSSTRMESVGVTTDGQTREAFRRDTPSSQAVNIPVQRPAALETLHPHISNPVHTEQQALESRIETGYGPTRDRGENYDSISEPTTSVTLSHEWGEEDHPRSNKKSSEERRRARHVSGPGRIVDHYSPPSRSTVTSPIQAIDPWRPQTSSSGLRAEPIRTMSPTAGRKRPAEHSDNDYGRRARRRDDVWIAPDHDHDRADSHRPLWDRRPDPESDGRRAAYRTPASPVERTWTEVPRVTHDHRTYSPEEPTALTPRLEQAHRRRENDDPYRRSQPPAPAHSPVADQHLTDSARARQTYEPVVEERTDAQPDPPLLARMGDTPYFPPRGRGRGEPSRGRGDLVRGRGRGHVARGGTPLIERLTTAPSNLGDRLT